MSKYTLNLNSSPSMFLLKLMVPLLFLSLMVPPKTVEAEFEQWCVADEQSTEDELQTALNWACGSGGADCTQIQQNQPCYLPNTLKDHASYAFNTYYQNFKHSGASCNFRGASIPTELDPSHGSCHYDFIP
ncbi:putative glucan endo-1,3-beta-D-glucosidase [Lupinus albus]|uniref:Putative glucan endo-1,3-beta-D-glucosidase n=1 Tax=Lupinus albus TaxID=3870 RepID=A0A6A4P970_LUPAL|nr:putative glucan endo-1,3-beta-D-glucosidase [Lupinus albus]